MPLQGCIKQVSKHDRFVGKLIVAWIVKKLPAFMEPVGSLPCCQDYYGYLCYQCYHCFIVGMVLRTRRKSFEMRTFSSLLLKSVAVELGLKKRLRVSDQMYLNLKHIFLSVTSKTKVLPVHIHNINLILSFISSYWTA